MDCIDSSIKCAEGSWGLKLLTMRAAVRQHKDFSSSFLTTYLQGLPSHHTVATPTWGAVFIISLLGTPAAYSIACAPGKSWSLVTAVDHRFNTGLPSLRVPCSIHGKSTYLGSSLMLSWFEVSIVRSLACERIDLTSRWMQEEQWWSIERYTRVCRQAEENRTTERCSTVYKMGSKRRTELYGVQLRQRDKGTCKKESGHYNVTYDSSISSFETCRLVWSKPSSATFRPTISPSSRTKRGGSFQLPVPFARFCPSP